MSTALTLDDRFGAFELPRSWRPTPHPKAGQQAERAPIRPLSASLSQVEPIKVSQRETYRLDAEEHDILYSALERSLEVRTTLSRD